MAQALRLNETQASVLEDLLDSSGWLTVIAKFALPYMAEMSSNSLTTLRNATTDTAWNTAKYSLGKRDGVKELIEKIYRELGAEIPPDLKKALK